MSIELWCEEYRPKVIDDCVLPPKIKNYFKDIVEKGVLENITIAGNPGNGKTTVARALCNELGVEYLFINASESGGIDTIRSTVKRYASSMDLNGSMKAVILDEADFLSPVAMASLRGVIEEFSSNCRFIFTCNFANRIIDPIKSRAPVIEFSYTKEERKNLIMSFDKRIKKILDDKGVEYDKLDVAHLIINNFPDFRKTINLLQRFTRNGRLEINGQTGLDDSTFNELVECLKEKNFTGMRKWVAENLDNDGSMLRRLLFDKSPKIMVKKSIPQLILFINEYDYKEASVVDKEINMVAFLTEVMFDCTFV